MVREAPKDPEERPEALRGEIARLRARVDDLEREKNAEARLASGLRAAEERLAVALETAGLGLFEWDLDRGTFWLHLPWIRELGYRPDELAARFEAWRALAHPDDRVRLSAALDGLRTAAPGRPGARTVEVVHRVRTADGEWRSVRLHGKVTARDPEGAVIRLSGTLQLLGPAEERASVEPHEVLEQLPVAVAVLDAAGGVVHANRAFSELVGAGDDAQASLRELARAAGSEAGAGALEFRDRTGAARRVECHAAEAGAHRVWVLHEVTERWTADQERERLIAELQRTLNDVRTLRGLIPICAHCKRIRDDEGYWSQIEDYLKATTEASFSHGLCPHCLDSLYPELEDGAQAPARK